MKNKNLKENKEYPIMEKQLSINGHSFRIIEQGKGRVVLFCHGFPDIAETWKNQMNSLANAGYRTIALDMRGFGGSYAPSDYKFYSAKHIVDDLINMLNILNIETAALVGHDWGADHAQKAMLMRPDRFKALVSLSIPFAPRGDMSYWNFLRKNGFENKYYAFEMMGNHLEKDYLPVEKTLKNILYWLSGSPINGTGWDPVDAKRNMFRSSPVDIPEWTTNEYVKKTISWFEKTGFQTGINHYRGMQTTFDEMPELKNKLITQPSLYIWGKKDGLCRFFHPEIPTLEDLQKVHPGLIKQVVLDNVGHWPQHEAAKIVSSEIIAFLQQINY
ncbi:alpha/beta fold hydrolase [Sphingobacterium sp. Mn56C]|uniref:alpha/beta fold hydrolase n=1 Tax=Sphingobacterium sp. Mn56C TaxID=3395261 RepID=UPI003BBB1E8A